MPTYEVIFRCTRTLEAENASEAIKKAWLRDTLDMKGRYKYLSIKQLKEPVAQW